MEQMEIRKITTDILIIGGGTAGCFAAVTLAEKSDISVLIAEKADIRRSGCLAAGVNALNAYILPGQTPETYLDYVRRDSEGVLREDLVYSLAKRLNAVTAKMEAFGLTIQKNESGGYAARGSRNIRINGENIKPLLAAAATQSSQVKVLNHVNIIDYIVQGGMVIGAYGFSLSQSIFYVISAKAVICATGGAAGLYRPNNPGISRHKMWYCPFNIGAGYAMGIRAGAEMTTFEMRFIALRCKDTIAPTGTIAQGVAAAQINRLGEEYDKNYGFSTTANRLYSTVMEKSGGRGPCYLKTAGIKPSVEAELFKAYLNMAPAQTLAWLESGQGPGAQNVEIEGTEPYLVGGHAASGYWVDANRATTLKGLFAAGDVAGGSPQKYVTGCWAEGEIAALAALKFIVGKSNSQTDDAAANVALTKLSRHFRIGGRFSAEELEEAMQKTMDNYAGGISTGYAYNCRSLEIAASRIDELLALSPELQADDNRQLLAIQEVIDRLHVCKIVIKHLKARQETRWRCFQENIDYPERDEINWRKLVNSRLEADKVKIIFRDLVAKDELYEHKD